MKLSCLSLVAFTLSLQCVAQNYYSIRQTQVNQTQVTQVNNINSGPSSYSLNYAVNTFANIFNDKKREAIAKEEAQAKLNLLKQNYSSYNSYPDSISTGWHDVIVTDNLRFCRGAKVFVKKNRVSEVVIENCLRLNFTAPGRIKNAKTTVTINKFNGEQFEIADVYFIYDIDEPALTSPPINPGYVTFWTTKNKYVDKKIMVDKIPYDGIRLAFDEEPECHTNGAVNLQLVPGIYSFRLLKSGNDLEGTIEVKSDQCLIHKIE
jgi:hypothetical protein